MRKRYRFRGMVWVLLILVAFLAMGSTSEAKRIKTVKLGTSCRLKGKGADFHSSDTAVAYVDETGRVTAKKMGTATISVKQKGHTSKQKIRVVANHKKKRHVTVCTGEVKILSNLLSYDKQEDGRAAQKYQAVVRVKNEGRKKAAKVILTGRIGGKSVSCRFGAMKAGETKTVTLQGIAEGTQNSMEPEKLLVYSHGMYTKYQYQTGKTTFHYGTPDTTPPKITGFVGKNSYNRDGKKRLMPYQVIYGRDKGYDYFKYVRATDDREGKVRLTVNTDRVNFKKTGVYKIVYRAEDQAGNVTKAKAKIQVRIPKTADAIADEVLRGIVKRSWSDLRKARAIYNYTRRHIAYVGYSNKSNWENEAINGIRYGRGDCYTYYAVARLLLTRAGIPNLEVTRVRGAGHHWWSMVYVKGGWYHYDCGPRRWGGRFCLLTDAQLKGYSKAHMNVYIWDYKKKPKTPKKQLSKIY